MNIGNDNYRPDLITPAPINKKLGWLSSNMAQLMVFMNGFILTITAFVTLNVFIQEIIKEDFVKSSKELQQQFVQGYDRIEDNIATILTFLEIIPSNQIQSSIGFIKTNIDDFKNFEELYWVDKRSEELVIVPLVENQNFTQDWMVAIKSYDKTVKEVNGVSTLDKNYLPSATQQMYSSIYSLIYKGKTGYLAALIDSQKLVNFSKLEENKKIFSVQIVDPVSGVMAYDYLSSYQYDQKKFESNHYITSGQIKFGNKDYTINISLVVEKKDIFLQRIPLLLLLFGVTLTLIGTLYVRNNQTQSSKLADANKKLAYKNYELHQEMSERERLNKIIQKSARENSAIINAVSDIIIELNRDGVILFVNASWKRVTGLLIEKTIGENFFSFIQAHEREEHKKSFNNLIKGQANKYRAIVNIICANGSLRNIEINIAMLRQDENGEIRAVGTIIDEEDRRRAELALSEAEKKYRTIVENAATGIYQVTAEGQLLSANPSYAKILGYNNVESLMQNIQNSKIQIYRYPLERENMLQEAKVHNSSKNYEIEVRQKDGRFIWISENIRSVTDDEENILFFEGSIEDIDQRKKAEIALKDAMKQSDMANRAKSEFLANMSHELRTPLNSVIGFAEIIKNEAFGKLAQPEYKEYAESIFTSGKKLLHIINEILDVSHITAGKRELKEGIINVKDTVDATVEMMKTKIQEKKIRLDNRVKNREFSLIGEGHAIKQMLLNLISNSVKYSPENAYIMIDCEVDVEGKMRLSVTDTGIGLTDSELEKALSPFGQVNSEFNRDNSGTGLGLTLVKSLIELHGGELEIVSQKNIGTTATLIFPAKRIHKVVQATPAQPVVSDANKYSLLSRNHTSEDV